MNVLAYVFFAAEFDWISSNWMLALMTVLLVGFFFFCLYMSSNSRLRTYPVDFSDDSASPPFKDAGFKIPTELQAPYRRFGHDDVVMEDISLLQFPEQLVERQVSLLDIAGLVAALPHRVDLYPDQLLDKLLSGQIPLPQHWRGKKIWFFGRVYYSPSHGGLVVRGLLCERGQERPTEIMLHHTEWLGKDDFIVGRHSKVVPPMPKLEIAPADVV